VFLIEYFGANTCYQYSKATSHFLGNILSIASTDKDLYDFLKKNLKRFSIEALEMKHSELSGLLNRTTRKDDQIVISYANSLEYFTELTHKVEKIFSLECDKTFKGNSTRRMSEVNDKKEIPERRKEEITLATSLIEFFDNVSNSMQPIGLELEDFEDSLMKPKLGKISCFSYSHLQIPGLEIITKQLGLLYHGEFVYIESVIKSLPDWISGNKSDCCRCKFQCNNNNCKCKRNDNNCNERCQCNRNLCENQFNMLDNDIE
jgi:hypothetical protein